MHSNLAPLILTKRIKYQKYHILLRHRGESRKKKLVVVTTTIVQACIIKRVVDKNGLGGLTVGATTFEFLGANAVVEKKRICEMVWYDGWIV